MNFKEIYKTAKNEAEWIKYYGHVDTRKSETFEDENFYDRIKSIGYAKVNTRLDVRCAMEFITSNGTPVMKSEMSSLKAVSGPRNHDKNVYTTLEYVIGNKLEGYEELVDIIKR